MQKSRNSQNQSVLFLKTLPMISSFLLKLMMFPWYFGFTSDPASKPFNFLVMQVEIYLLFIHFFYPFMLTRARLEEVTFSLLAEGTVQASKAQYSFHSRTFLQVQHRYYPTHPSFSVSHDKPPPLARLSWKCPNIIQLCLFYLIIKMVILCSVQGVVGSRNK